MTWKYRYNPLQYTIVLFAFQIVMNWFHELGHIMPGSLGGGVLRTVGVGFGVFYVDWAVDPTGLWGWLMPFGGGLITAAFCYIAMWGSDRDDDVRIAFYSIGMTQLAYGLVEDSLFHLKLYDWNPIVGGMAMIAAILYSVLTAKKMWIMEEIENTA